MRTGLISMGLADPTILVQFVFPKFLCYLPNGYVLRHAYDQILCSVFFNYHLFFFLMPLAQTSCRKNKGRAGCKVRRQLGCKNPLFFNPFGK